MDRWVRGVQPKEVLQEAMEETADADANHVTALQIVGQAKQSIASDVDAWKKEASTTYFSINANAEKMMDDLRRVLASVQILPISQETESVVQDMRADLESCLNQGRRVDAARRCEYARTIDLLEKMEEDLDSIPEETHDGKRAAVLPCLPSPQKDKKAAFTAVSERVITWLNITQVSEGAEDLRTTTAQNSSLSEAKFLIQSLLKETSDLLTDKALDAAGLTAQQQQQHLNRTKKER
eukprot:3114369-Rhodomonas_salina.2